MLIIWRLEMKRVASFVIGCLMLSGCCSKVGPSNLRRDSMAYNHVVNNSVDSQILLNIVRLRYRDTPTFLQVGLVSSAYEFKRSASSELKLVDGSGPNITFTPKIGVDYTEKPTVTYQPLRGQDFVKEMLSPIPLDVIVLLHSSGWNIDRVLRNCVQRMNSVHNAPSASGPTPKNAPQYHQFLELVQLFRELEINDSIDIVKEKNPKTEQEDFFIILDTEHGDQAALNQIWQKLGLEPGADHIRLVNYHGKTHRKDEIVIDTRSPLSMFYFLSHGVHIPQWDQQCGKVTCTADDHGYPFNWDEVLGGVMTIHSGPFYGSEPAVLVNYRGVNFYIDDSDLDSKSTFSMIAQLLALQSGVPQIPAVLTIPIAN